MPPIRVLVRVEGRNPRAARNKLFDSVLKYRVYSVVALAIRWRNRFVNIERLRDYFVDVFPAMNLEQKRLAIALYRELAIGTPVAVSRLAESVEQSRAEIERVLHEWPGVFFRCRKSSGRVLGHRDSENDPPHARQRADRVCVVRLGYAVHPAIARPDRARRLGLSGHGRGNLAFGHAGPGRTARPARNTGFITDSESRQDPPGRDDQFLSPRFFFASLAAAEEWVTANPDGFLLTLESAFEPGNAVNLARW